ncbi:PilZ domain-containing protein [Planococcus sp. CP5-4]|uniref:PilZ domain-containing protein n=1 Tax=unclassified Planococcus (in: firmicutes) TaxID=2662419 RepID=UPI001C22E47A|nr:MULTISPECIES: PilZ domain-containing protein [unclassified Planococcus (in: firmicutes)]MBU9672580.1 PilZ domain-containing protein [Planococcus sp. CP5-4_YE]MBV0909630.1 PilZ domain-containing protein [Planococcus sp. CP5-4_UN]MBW6064360.1 PilZ domain-containing protein [Planococcus sp. CP5-4]
MGDNRREFFRVSFIRAIDGKVVVPEREEVLVDISSLSAGGLVFTAYLDFALHEQVICSFELLDEPFELEGKIIRKLAKEHNFEYAVQFNAGQRSVSKLFQQLNTYQIRKRKSVLND